MTFLSNKNSGRVAFVPDSDQVQAVLDTVTRRGIVVDGEALKNSRDQAVEKVGAVAKNLGWSRAGFPEDKFLQSVLSEEQGSEIRSLKLELLQVMEDEGSSVAHEVRVIKSLLCDVNNFYTPMLDAVVEGKIHSKFNANGAVSGRMTSFDPCVQNVAKRLRSFFLADNDRYCVVSVDYQAIEPRICAGVAGETLLMKAAWDGDFYENVMLLMFPEWTSFDAALKRKEFKTLLISVLYGSAVKSLKRELLTVEEVERLHAKTRVLFRGFFAKVREKVKQWEKDKECRIVGLDNVSHYYLPQDSAYKAGNLLIQAAARSVFGAAILRLRDAGLAPFIRGFFHDEIIFCIPFLGADRRIVKIVDIFCDTGTRVSFSVNVAVKGSDWAGKAVLKQRVVKDDCALLWSAAERNLLGVRSACWLDKQLRTACSALHDHVEEKPLIVNLEERMVCRLVRS